MNSFKKLLSRIYRTILTTNIVESIIFFVAFFVGLNLFNSGKVFFIILLPLSLFAGVIKKKIYLSPSLLLIVLLGIILFASYSVFAHSFSVSVAVYFILCPITMSIIGLLFSHGTIKNFYKNLCQFIFMLGLGFFLRGTINSIATIMSFGFKLEARFYINILGNNQLTVATAITPSFVIGIPLIFTGLSFLIHDRKISSIAVLFITSIISVLSILFSILLGNRVILVILIVCASVAILIWLREKIINRKIQIVIISIVSVVFLLLFFLMIDPLNLASDTFKNNFIYRLFSGGSDSERLSIYKQFFKQFYHYPMGGMFMKDWFLKSNGTYGQSFVHNSWLDMYLYGGIFSSLIFIVLTLVGFKNALKIFLSNGIELKPKIFILSIFVSFVVYLAVEPAMLSDPYLFSVFFLFLSAFERINRRYLYSAKKAKNFEFGSYKVLFITNQLSIHTRELHYSFINALGDRYQMITLNGDSNTHNIYDESLKNRDQFELRQTTKDINAIRKIANDFDVVIYGNIPFKLLVLLHLSRKKKIYFKISERMYKKNKYEMYNPIKMVANFVHFTMLDFMHDYLLTLSSYAYYDFSCIDCFCGRSYSFGYFIKESSMRCFNEKRQQSECLRIIYVNRLIDWKHPEHALLLAKLMRDKRIKFSLTIIGDGDMANQLFLQTNEWKLNDYVTFIKNIPNEVVRDLMERSDIVLSTSSRTEGWGACVAEGMASGCIVISSNTTGSSYELISNGKNGFVYEFGNINQMFDIISDLYKCDKNTIYSIQKNAFNFINSFYNSKTAVFRLLSLIDNLSKGNDDNLYSDSICSKSIINSDILTENEYYKKEKTIENEIITEINI